MLWCIVICSLFSVLYLYCSPPPIILLAVPISPPPLFFPMVYSQWIPLHTLCCLSPFVQKHHPLNLGIILTTTIVDFGNLINLYPAHHADPVLWMFLAVMPVCRVSMHLLTDVVVDVRTCDVEGEEIFVSLRDEVLDCLLLVLYFYFLRVHMMCTFCCPSLLSLPRACRTLVVCIVDGDDGVRLDPLMFPWRLEATYFVRKRRSGPTKSYRRLLDVLQTII